MLKVIKNFAPAAIFVAAILTLGVLSEQSSAIQIHSDLVVRVHSSLSLIVPRQEVRLMLNPNNNEVVFQDLGINLSTNNKNGAKVYMTTNRAGGLQQVENNWQKRATSEFSSATSLVGRNTGYEIEAVSDYPSSEWQIGHHFSVPVEDFPKGKWGVSIDGGATYAGVPAKGDTYLVVIDKEQPSVNEQATIRFGARSKDELPSDYYENTVIFTAVATFSPKTINSIIYMQEIDAEVADSMAEGAQYQLMDIRDGKKYWISRLADGNIWMTQNLNLDLSSDVALTPDDTDIRENWTPLYSTVPDLNSEYDGWVKDGSSPRSFGVTTQYDYKYGFSGVYSSLSNCESQNTTYEFCEHYNVGKYYNWAAAIAKNDITAIAEDGETINIDQSICPAGWRLPIGYQGEYEQSDFAKLIDKSKIATVNTGRDGYSDANYLANGFDTIKTSPLFIATADAKITPGRSVSSLPSSYATYWTSTIHNAPNVDVFTFENNSARTLLPNTVISSGDAFDNLGIGRSVRCMARPTHVHRINYTDGYGGIIASQIEENSSSTWTMTLQPSKYISSEAYNNFNLSNMKYWTCYDGTGSNYYSYAQEGSTVTFSSDSVLSCYANFD